MRVYLLMFFLASFFLTACVNANDEFHAFSLPHGFSIEVFTDDVPRARSLANGANGVVFVSTREGGRIYALIPNSGSQPTVVTFASSLKVPNGIAYRDGDLFVAEQTRISRYRNVDNRLDNPPAAEVILDGLPSENHHRDRYLSIGPDNKLYFSIGMPCNICERKGFGIISRVNMDGSGREVFAYGIRNSLGQAWHAETGDLWFTDNGRDMLGDDIPPDELNRASETGQHFGYPACHAGYIEDDKFGSAGACDNYTKPEQKLNAHVAPLGLRFYDGDMFPAEYRGSLFIAEHGSWNRSKKIGYRVSMATIKDGAVTRYAPFVEGWLQGESASGRPVDVLVWIDGSLLISDDKAGRIYRVSYAPD